MDTLTAFLAPDGFDLALLVAAMVCAAVLCASAVGHLAAAIAQRGRRARVARALGGWLTVAE